MCYVDFPEIRVARQNFMCHSYFKAKPQESTHHGNYCFKACIIVYLCRNGSDHVPAWNGGDILLINSLNNLILAGFHLKHSFFWYMLPNK